MLRQLGGIAQTGPYIAGAPFAVVVCIEDTDFAVSDASRAVQSMVLTAWSEGIGSNWAGFRNVEGARPILGIPGNLEVLAIVPFGYPARPVGKGRKQRKPFAQVVSRNRYGEPFA
jgi:nitroreductase